jgi:hypothetical protein
MRPSDVERLRRRAPEGYVARELSRVLHPIRGAQPAQPGRRSPLPRRRSAPPSEHRVATAWSHLTVRQMAMRPEPPSHGGDASSRSRATMSPASRAKKSRAATPPGDFFACRVERRRRRHNCAAQAHGAEKRIPSQPFRGRWFTTSSAMRRASFVRGHNKTACPGMDRLAVEPSDDAAGGLAQRDSCRELHAVA